METTERKYIQKLEELIAMMLPHAEFYGAESDSFMNLLSQVNRLKAEIEQPEPVPVSAATVLRNMFIEKHIITEHADDSWMHYDDIQAAIEAMEEYASQFQSKPTDEQRQEITDKQISRAAEYNKKHYANVYKITAGNAFWDGVKWLQSKQVKGIDLREEKLCQCKIPDKKPHSNLCNTCNKHTY